MVLVTPCFNMRGQCEEAIKLYELALGATTKLLLRYADADPRDWDTPLTAKQRNMVYHAEVYIGEQRVMFSDIVDTDAIQHIVQGTAMFLVVTFDTAEQVKHAYEILKEGCTIIQPMVSATYSSCFVSLVDRFGFRWVLMTEQAE